MNPIGTIPLETDRLTLRRITSNDTYNIYSEILGDKERLNFLDWEFSKDINAAESFIENILDCYTNEYYFFWVIEEKITMKFAGCILVCNSDIKKRLAEIEYVASSKVQGQGYMTEALNRVIKFLTKEVGYYRIEGVCNVENAASSRVMEKAGMSFEGILRGRALNLNEFGNPGDLKMFSYIPSDIKCQ